MRTRAQADLEMTAHVAALPSPPRAPVPEGGRRLDTSFIWQKIKEIEVVSPTRAIVHFSEPMPSGRRCVGAIARYPM